VPDAGDPELAPRVAAELFDRDRPGAETVETHVSTVVFEGDVAHKRKRPVHFAFVDLSTPERRAEVCQREIEVNRRFSPDVYLGVEDVVDAAGNVVDHAVLMRRMPSERRLSTLVAQRQDVRSCLRVVARQMAAAHAGAAVSDEISTVATRDALEELWGGNLRELAPFVPRPLDPEPLERIEELAHRYLAGRDALLAERIARGRVLDGHGDLLADDIFCLDDGPRILDALEFDDRLRWGDVLYDVGFLAMDLERLGHVDLAFAFLDWYAEYSAETHPLSLEHFYVAYRALVRTKISCLKGGPGDEQEARAYLAQCQRHLQAGRVQLVIVGGLPGTGKSTLADVLGDQLAWPVLRSDEIRKELSGMSPLEPAPAPYGEGIYSPAATAATYDALLARAEQLLRRGESVIVDASFSKVRWRTAAAQTAAGAWADLTALRCVLPPRLAAARLAERAAAGGTASDANSAIATDMARQFDSWPSAATVETLGPIADILPGVLDVLDRAVLHRRARPARDAAG
jgi:hypothetical protein